MRHQSLRFAPETESTSPTATWLTERSKSKRIAHGGGAWSLPDPEGRLRQPQDGARLSGAEEQNARVGRSPMSEPEDAGITGGTRSLMRRVMGLNVTARQDVRKPVRSALGTNTHAQVA